MTIAGLYGMADAGHGDPVAQARLLAEEGVAPIQLRCKGFTREQLREVLRACRDVPGIVVNDDAVVASEFGCPVHLGQDDGRTSLPHGRSTHTLDHVFAVTGATYIAFGPVFGTATKDSPWTPRGLDLLAQAVRVSPRPVVAIGGIGTHNLAQVRATGVAGWAVIGAIWRSADPLAAIRNLR